MKADFFPPALGKPKVPNPRYLHLSCSIHEVTRLHWFYLCKTFVLGYGWLTNSTVIVSGKQPRDSAIHIHVSIPHPQTAPQSRLPHIIEQSSMYYTVGPYWLSILNVHWFKGLNQKFYWRLKCHFKSNKTLFFLKNCYVKNFPLRSTVPHHWSHWAPVLSSSSPPPPPDCLTWSLIRKNYQQPHTLSNWLFQ